METLTSKFQLIKELKISKIFTIRSKSSINFIAIAQNTTLEDISAKKYLNIMKPFSS